MSKQVFELNSKFTFGKYKGEKVKDIMEQDDQYVRWCIDSVHFFELSEEALDYFHTIEIEREPDPDEEEAFRYGYGADIGDR